MTSRIVWHEFGAKGAEEEAQPLVLFHGGHGSHEHWVRNVEALSKRFRVLVPDLPGYGESSMPPEPTMASLVDSICAAIDVRVGANTAIRLAGFSFGGLAAALIASKREKISHLALLGPAGHGTTRRPIGKLQDWKDALEANNYVTLRPSIQKIMRHNLLMHMLAKESSVDDAAISIHASACVKTRFFSKKISRAGGLMDALVAARQTNPDMSVSALWGEHDVTCTPADVLAWMEAKIGLERSHIILNSGHWVQYEAAEAVNEFLLEVL